jgi:hypothetical protein
MIGWDKEMLRSHIFSSGKAVLPSVWNMPPCGHPSQPGQSFVIGLEKYRYLLSRSQLQMAFPGALCASRGFPLAAM